MDCYFALFNAVTDAISALDRLKAQLEQAQQAAEDAYIRTPDR